MVSILTWNVNGLAKRMADVTDIMASYNPDILTL